MDKTVLIVGVTGGQGNAAARALLRDGWRVRGLTRNPDSDAGLALTRAGVELVRGDLDDPTSVAEALRGADAVFAVVNWFGVGVDTEQRWAIQLADAAVAAGVDHFVYSSVVRADAGTGVPHFDSKAAVERHLAGLPLRTTVLRPAIFMEDLTDARYVPAASWGMMPRLAGPDTPIPWVALDDVGAAVARVLADPDRYAGEAVPLVGDVRTMRDARAAFRSAGRRAFGLPMPAWLFERLVSRELVAMWRWLGEQGDWRATDSDLRDMRTWLAG